VSAGAGPAERPISLLNAPSRPQTYHWNDKRKITQFYSELAVKELADEHARKAELSAKLQELESALSS
jgi:hypothetical protein